jgi:hypothetical protein
MLILIAKYSEGSGCDIIKAISGSFFGGAEDIRISGVEPSSCRYANLPRYAAV